MAYAVAICTPMPTIAGPQGPRLEPITVEWHRARSALGLPTGFNFLDVRMDGKEVGVARCDAVDAVMQAEPRPEFLFFLDYDVLPSFDALTKLFYRARCYPDHDIFAGVYCSKGSPPEPLLYTQQGTGPYWDWCVGDVLTDNRVSGVHMGLTLIRTSLFERMDYGPSNPLFKTVRKKTLTLKGVISESGTEDLYFCDRAVREANAKILVDTSVLAGHILNATGKIYGLPDDSPPVQGAWWLRQRCKHGVASSRHRPDQTDTPGLCECCGHWADGETLCKTCREEPPVKRALDLGAGGIRREWDGYETVTTDIRDNVGADFVMDTRLLNFPDEQFDMVASSHHLEHFGRWEQEKLWQEMARILKPGGRMEHVVPNLQWAGRKLANGEDDAATFDVLFGGQEMTDGIKLEERDWNTHYFGYTPAIARAMAEEVAGLVDVEIRTYEDDENLGFNLIVSGVKPEAAAEVPEEVATP